MATATAPQARKQAARTLPFNTEDHRVQVGDFTFKVRLHRNPRAERDMRGALVEILGAFDHEGIRCTLKELAMEGGFLSVDGMLAEIRQTLSQDLRMIDDDGVDTDPRADDDAIVTPGGYRV